MKKLQLRRHPPRQTIICLPLPKGGYAYLAATRGTHWIYNFITPAPIFTRSLFGSSHWLKNVDLYEDGVSADSFDVGSVNFTEDEMKLPKTYKRIAPEKPGDPPRYRATDPHAKDRTRLQYYITEADLPDYQESLCITNRQLLTHLEEIRPQMKVLEIEPEWVVLPKPNSGNTFEPPSVFEIWLSELKRMKVTDLQGIAEEIDAELEIHDGGEVLGTGQVVGDDQHSIAVTHSPGRHKQALACIRRVLLRLKADPETTDIWEQKPDADDHIEHPLLAPSNGK